MHLKRLLRAIVRRLPLIRRYEIRKRSWTFNGRRAYERSKHIRYLDGRGATRIHYACGRHFFDDWLNVDSYLQGDPGAAAFACVNLTSRHPFPDDTFEYGFAEDFVEHLEQVDSLLFLSECLRTLRPAGVLRLSFPGLEGVLRKHYPRSDWETMNVAKEEAYTRFEHVHFYARGEVELVARHLGFTAVAFCRFGESAHPPLRGIDQRAAQRDLNTYVELTK